MREYAAATGGAPVAATGPAVAPPAFAACFTVMRGTDLFDDPELGAHPNVIHGSQSYVLHRPIRVGDTLDCTARIADIRSRGGMDLLTLEVDCVDAATGDPVVSSTGTLVFVGER